MGFAFFTGNESLVFFFFFFFSQRTRESAPYNMAVWESAGRALTLSEKLDY